MTEQQLLDLISALNLYSSFFLFLIVICFAAFIAILVIFIHNIKNRKSIQENKEFISEIIQTQEAERERISQELHDTVSQNIKAILIKEKELLDEIGKQAQGTEQLQKIISLEKQNQKELRSIMQDLNLPFQKGISFKSAINDLCVRFKDESSCSCVLFISPEVDLEKFTQEERHHILRIIQEALNNAMMHADASETSVVINKGEKPGLVCIMIFDDGHGFEKSRATSDGNTHFGMTGMEMRAKLLGGNLTVTSNAESGTEVRLEIGKEAEDKNVTNLTILG